MPAILFGLLAALGSLTGPEPSFPKPAIEHIRVAGDTVWFEGTRGFDTVAIRYCFVRRTGAWCRLPLPASASAVADRLPRSPRDSTVLAPGLTLVCRASETWPMSCDTFGVRTVDDRRVHWLIPQASRSLREALQRAIEFESDELPTISTFITARVADRRSIWFGLGGGFPEGEGAFGGLLRFDRDRRTVETITHPRLSNATITDLAVDGNALWIGTLHPGEYGPWGSTGILRRDLQTGEWAQLDSSTTRLPDNLVRSLHAADGMVYVATADGLAAYDVTSRRWNVRFFRRTIIADSIVYALATARPADEAGDEAMFVLMQELRVTRREAFAATMRQIGLTRLHRVLVPTGDTFAEALAHPAVLPFLVDALGDAHAAPLAARALARIGDRRAIPPLQRALAAASGPRSGPSIAAALGQLGDSTGLAWLHGQLRSPAPYHVHRELLTALSTVRDTTSVSSVLALATRSDVREELRTAAVQALRAYESVRVWRQLVEAARQDPRLRPPVVAGADSVALSDSSVADVLGSWALALLDSNSSGQHMYGVVNVAVRLRPHEAVRALVNTVAASEAWGAVAAQELVRLTGVDSAPAVDPWSADGRQLARDFWARWWSANAATYRVADPEAGQRAYDAWFERVLRQRQLERERRRAGRRDG